MLYSNEGRGTGRCKLLDGGDLVLYDRRGRVVWSTGTDGDPGATLAVDDDGIELRNSEGTVVWSVRTTPGAELSEMSELSAATAAIAPVAATMAQPMVPCAAAEMTAAVPAVPAENPVPAEEPES
ncbi:hypothetical protein [Saccharopolyspora mangrovi]|uniref:Bulb-type lectin domain-containing protein n=1 Tax=Saccharopolyspora mangrovi TaxID=3082379 RepID=A0ABU6A714_9PSEU|nr:hypothetical protein [Saccharopolyspora sp. S2-29]MEB3367357.1 hypothetical protein [Saccharopolyspora sp. S2-29]